MRNDDARPSLDRYFQDGEARARRLNNRGPIRFTDKGSLDPAILEAYNEAGFYIFENVVAPEEVGDLKADLGRLLDRAPVAPGAAVDRQGRPALGADRPNQIVGWSKPLGDRMGGTAKLGGRSPVKMLELETPADAPEDVIFGITAPLQFSDAALRLYAHPGLLKVAAAINGEDFAPFQEAFLIKQPGLGCAVPWHQDGTTHWDRPDWDAGIHGFNFFVQLYQSTAANGLWYVPGSHRLGRIDIARLVEEGGGNMLPGAVPLICQAGDVAMSNRQIVHGSFPNASDDWRVAFAMGFHRRGEVEGARYRRDDGEVVTYEPAMVRKRAAMIGYAISARRQHFKTETPFVYQPHVRAGERYDWGEAARAAISGYEALDLRI